MRYTPSFSFSIIEESRFECEIENITEKLNECKEEGFFTSFDGTKIFYEYFMCENAKANVVIVHGLSEFTKKYYEFATYILNQGYNVFLYDQRCHGLSDRLTSDKDVIHVKSYRDYSKDLEWYIDNIVLKAEKKPIYIYSHSMGGGVAATYLTKDYCKAEKAVLSAPLLEPYVGNVPVWFAKSGIKLLSLVVGSHKIFSGSREFNPEYKFENSDDESYSRFRYNMDLRINNENYQTTPMSLGWVNATLGNSLYIKRQRNIDKIKIPVLLISAENDRAVRTPPHYVFDSMCNMCTLKVMKDAKHPMLTSTNDIISQHVNAVIDFFK